VNLDLDLQEAVPAMERVESLLVVMEGDRVAPRASTSSTAILDENVQPTSKESSNAAMMYCDTGHSESFACSDASKCARKREADYSPDKSTCITNAQSKKTAALYADFRASLATTPLNEIPIDRTVLVATGSTFGSTKENGKMNRIQEEFSTGPLVLGITGTWTGWLNR